MKEDLILKQNLLTVISWYKTKQNAGTICKTFRDTNFTPKLETQNILESSKEINKICEKKRSLLKNDLATCLEKDFSGKILFCEYDNSLLCGTSEYETQGFFDSHDRPGWETYFYCFSYKSPIEEDIRVVTCWIPEEYIPIADRGIYCNPYGCIYWYDSTILSVSKMIQFSIKTLG